MHLSSVVTLNQLHFPCSDCCESDSSNHVGTSVKNITNLVSANFQEFTGVLVNPGWASQQSDGCWISRLKRIPLPSLAPNGFIFIWLAKNQIEDVWKLLMAWGYVYVENLTWVFLMPNNQVVLCDGGLTRVSHLTLYIFRKFGEGKHIEIKHQRSPDVILQCGHPEAFNNGWKVPEEVYACLETMLPGGIGGFLELWSCKSAARPGWVHIHELLID